MAVAEKTTEEKLRELDRAIAGKEAAIAVPTARPKPSRVTAAPLSPRARLVRRILAWIIGLWCALCFLVMAADERVWADPMMLLGMAVFTVFVAGMLYQGYLWQWELAKAIANWSRRALKGNRAPD